MEPVYFSSILVGEHFDEEHLSRALFGRISDIKNLPQGYRLNQPYISSFSFSKIPIAEKAPKYGFCWVERWSEIELINQRTGKLTSNNNSNKNSASVSKLSKCEMFKRIVKLRPITYGDLKDSAIPYQKGKFVMDELLKGKGHGARLESSYELDNFSSVN